MKSRILYAIISLLSVAAAFMAVVLCALAVIGWISQHELRGDLFAAPFALLIAALLLYGLWDTGTRLVRVEESQRRLMREIERTRDERAA